MSASPGTSVAEVQTAKTPILDGSTVLVVGASRGTSRFNWSKLANAYSRVFLSAFLFLSLIVLIFRFALTVCRSRS
jgi:hypothetical protein